MYNLRVADFHSYFVGSEEWGFSVWAHNAACTLDKNGKWHDEKGKFTAAPSSTDPIKISKMRQVHIIHGDVPVAGGGGHAARATIAGKDRFPATLKDADIVTGAVRIANDPASYPAGVVPVGKKPGSRYAATVDIGGTPTTVIVEPRGEGIITAWPR